MSKVFPILLVLLWLWLGLGDVEASAQGVPATATDVLVEMATHAAVIFSGEVVAVERHDAAGFADVKFRVDEAVRGCHAGRHYLLREWAGRWAGRADRYTTGQTLLMLLPARAPSGMSAPVYGSDGAIPIVAGVAGPVGSGDATAALPGAIVDLALLAARVPRNPQEGAVSPVQTAARLAQPQATPIAVTRASLPVALELLRGSVYVP